VGARQLQFTPLLWLDWRSSGSQQWCRPLSRSADLAAPGHFPTGCAWPGTPLFLRRECFRCLAQSISLRLRGSRLLSPPGPSSHNMLPPSGNFRSLALLAWLPAAGPHTQNVPAIRELSPPRSTDLATAELSPTGLCTRKMSPPSGNFPPMVGARFCTPPLCHHSKMFAPSAKFAASPALLAWLPVASPAWAIILQNVPGKRELSPVGTQRHRPPPRSLTLALGHHPNPDLTHPTLHQPLAFLLSHSPPKPISPPSPVASSLTTRCLSIFKPSTLPTHFRPSLPAPQAIS
jgi:hypothetical protein